MYCFYLILNRWAAKASVSVGVFFNREKWWKLYKYYGI